VSIVIDLPDDSEANTQNPDSNDNILNTEDMDQVRILAQAGHSPSSGIGGNELLNIYLEQ
jgi:hypothetical protein